MSDTTYAYSCAANLLLYDADPGPRETNVGSASEPRIGDRREALLNLYARQVLVELRADLARALRLRRDCDRKAADVMTLRNAIRAVRFRRAHGAAWPSALSALTGRSRRDIAEVWTMAAALAAEAARIVREAGADRDEHARARLLAATQHSLTCDILGAVLPADVLAESAQDLADTLRDLDENG